MLSRFSRKYRCIRLSSSSSLRIPVSSSSITVRQQSGFWDSKSGFSEITIIWFSRQQSGLKTAVQTFNGDARTKYQMTVESTDNVAKRTFEISYTHYRQTNSYLGYIKATYVYHDKRPTKIFEENFEFRKKKSSEISSKIAKIAYFLNLNCGFPVDFGR